MDEMTARIRELNDQLRKDLTLGTAVMTPGIAALGTEVVERIVHFISAYDSFTVSNDPYGERDFGELETEGQRILFKIDYFDKALQFHSPDPCDPSATERVMTIMLAEEY